MTSFKTGGQRIIYKHIYVLVQFYKYNFNTYERRSNFNEVPVGLLSSAPNVQLMDLFV